MRGFEVEENGKFMLGDKEKKKLEVRGGVLLLRGAVQLLRFLRAWARVVLHSRCEAGERGTCLEAEE